jgi:hypothetical protein
MRSSLSQTVVFQDYERIALVMTDQLRVVPIAYLLYMRGKICYTVGWPSWLWRQVKVHLNE